VEGNSLRTRKGNEFRANQDDADGGSKKKERDSMVTYLLSGEDVEGDSTISLKSSSLTECLMDGYDSDSCKANSNGECVFCAEPAYGLCVTPSAAEKLSRFPFFNCDL